MIIILAKNQFFQKTKKKEMYTSMKVLKSNWSDY
jgi:hypothetical protein